MWVSEYLVLVWAGERGLRTHDLGEQGGGTETTIGG